MRLLPAVLLALVAVSLAPLGGCPTGSSARDHEPASRAPTSSAGAEVVPDPDRDADGVTDGRDRCPDAQEDYDAFEDDDGCPDADDDPQTIMDVCTDEDADGIDDADDRCP